ncbi:MAG: RagB/SusD family nutrient uptake outer membrane protein [Paludibacter sp.]|nr:RagB/SusD family nutrient uptake outer membrane protein [Paludibacter sp.]
MNIFKIILGVILFSLFSCNDMLVVSSKSLLSDDQVFNNPDSTKEAISAIFDIIGQNNSYRNRLWLQMGTNTDTEYRPGWTSGTVLSSIKSDDYFSLYNANSSVGDGYSNSGSDNPWNRIYQGIERSNLAIAGIRKYGKPEAGNDMGHYLGVALTMRAYFYYDLIKWWGDVPAWFDPMTAATIYIPKTNRDTIYNHIIGDLQEATALLYSANKPLTNMTTLVSKDAARGLLARICLSAAGYSMRPLGTSDAQIVITATPARQTELYTIAREACRGIINDGLYTLDSSFQDIFYQQCQDNQTPGGETIWQLPYKMGTRGRMVYNLGLPRDPDGKNNTVTIGGQFQVMPSFYYDYDVNDTRRDVTVVPYKVQKNSVLGVMEQNVNAGIVGFNIAKWRAEWVKTPITGTDDGVSPIILRYADVLLMFAESDLFLGGTEGQNYFNMVRRRAFGQPINATSPYDIPLTLANLQQERAFEFCGENIRKYDLERWGMLKSAIDQAENNLRALRDGTGNYANVPSTIYYKWSTPTSAPTTGERVLTIYGLQRGENDNKTVTDPTGGWTPKVWTQGLSGTSLMLSEGFITNLYFNNPDTHQLLPIMHQIISVSNGLLSNDYGYGN